MQLDHLKTVLGVDCTEVQTSKLVLYRRGTIELFKLKAKLVSRSFYRFGCSLQRPANTKNRINIAELMLAINSKRESLAIQLTF